MNKWRSITYVCVPSVIALTTYMMATQEHPHEQEHVAFPYLRLRSKVRARLEWLVFSDSPLVRCGRGAATSRCSVRLLRGANCAAPDQLVDAEHAPKEHKAHH